MKKRGFFFVALGLTAATMAYAADQNYTDLGTAQTLEVTENKLSDAQVNTGSTVTVITREQIENYHAESTADLLNKAIGTYFSTYGAIGSESKVEIRGTGTYRAQIYIDGTKASRVADGYFDLSVIPVSIIDHVEIIKAGSGNIGGAAVAGGIVNIVTKKAQPSTKEHYEISFENGSYLPKEYIDLDDGSDDNRAWRALADTQKGDFTYTNSFGGINLLANIGGYYATNKYTFDYDGDGTYLREHAAASDVHASINLDGKCLDDGTWQSNNLVSYQHLETPGDMKYSPAAATLDNYQNQFTFNTNNQFLFGRYNIRTNYQYNRVGYHDTTSMTGYNSHHNKHMLNVSAEESWKPSETITITTGEELTWNFQESTKVKTKNRVEPRVYANGAFYFLDNKVGIYPMLSLAYISDMEKLSPSASLGTVYNPLDQLDLSLTLGYAETVPNFDLLYWNSETGSSVYSGTTYYYKSIYANEDLDIEHDWSVELGLSYHNKYFSYEGSAFAKYMKDAMYYSNSTGYDSNTGYSLYYYIYDNWDAAALFGTDQSIKITPVQGLTLSASYLFNKSYDLSGDNDLGDDVEIDWVRKHTAKLGIMYDWDYISASLDANYYGKTKSSGHDVDDFWLVNLSVTGHVMENLDVYAAIDNLFNKTYYFYYYYPMPGMKIRLGGTWKF